MKPVLPLPLDIRLMRAGTQLLFVLAALLLLAALCAWLARHPVFAIRAIVIQGEVSHNNALTLRANVAPRLSGTFSRLI